MRSALLAVFVLVLALLVPVGAGAEPVPPFDGLMSFPVIQGPDGPEEFSWEMKLGDEEELRQIDATHAGIFWPDDTKAMSIEAGQAHAADGATVPTTLTVTQPNVITLTVHHRDGNPAAGGAPFDYPVVAGVGWEGGFKTEEAIVIPGEQPPSEPTCIVPDLANRTLRASRRILHTSHCRLGRVRGERSRAVHVVEQYRQVAKVLPVWTRVDVKALRAAQYSRSS
jgi:hypothetical protein